MTTDFAIRSHVGTGRTVLLKRESHGPTRFARVNDYDWRLKHWVLFNPAPDYMKERRAYLAWKAERDAFIANFYAIPASMEAWMELGR